MTDGTIKVLYNDCYGGFNLSQEFLTEYERRTKKPVDPVRMSFRVGENSIRTDPVAIAIWEERGSEWCSGPDSAIECYEIPAIFARYWEIEEYEGDETVHVGLDTALADCLHTYMETNDIDALRQSYRALVEAHRRLREAPATGGAPRLLKTPSEMSSDDAPQVLTPLSQKEADGGPSVLKTPPQTDVTTPPRHDSCCDGGTRGPCAGCP